MSFEDLESGRSRPLTLIGRNSQDPSQSIVAGVFQINTAVASFQRLVNTLGTPKDTLELRQKLHKTRLHIGQLVKETSAKLKQASETDQHTEAGKKIADAKLAKDFQSVLREFQRAQRLSAERETAYAPFVPKDVPSSRNIASEVEISSSRSSEQISLLVESKRHEALQLENEIIFNEAVIEERDQGIREVQEQIGEVNEIFKDLAVLVREQGVMIDLFVAGDFWDHSSYRGHSFRGMSIGAADLLKAALVPRVVKMAFSGASSAMFFQFWYQADEDVATLAKLFLFFHQKDVYDEE
ncbi:hypothetical protein RJ640_028396 [Escallonia rubra]|uniref:t-SNARE coiled-coil homology domain-containing protein n=1 Tax=Escallonia rubra TaxID=112253 RepID=A0AA88U6J5_9ASTE|nr:hypothetical protein RJ640_028396 [Escallonia rubra]